MEKFEAVDSKMRELSEKLQESKELNRRLQDRVTELQEAQVEKKQGKMKLGLLWSSWLKRKDDGTATKSWFTLSLSLLLFLFNYKIKFLLAKETLCNLML